MSNMFAKLVGLHKPYQVQAEFSPSEERKLKKQSELITRNFKELMETLGSGRALMSFMLLSPPFSLEGKRSEAGRNYKALYDDSFPSPRIVPAFFEMSDRQVVIGYDYSIIDLALELTGSPQSDSQILNKAQETLNKILPKFQIPTQWKTDQDGNKILSFNKGATQTNSLTLEEVSRLRVATSGFPAVSMPPDRRLALSKTYKRVFGQIGYLRFGVDWMSSGINAQLDGNSGKLLGVSGELVLRIRIQAEVRLPKKIAFWMTYATDDQTFLPYSFAEHFLTLWAYGNPKSRGKKRRPAVRRSTPIHVAGLIKKGAKTSKLGSRVNQEGFVVLKNGAALYLPEGVNRLDSVINRIKAAYDPEEQRLNKLDLEADADQPVAVDWINQKFIFTTRSNSLDVISLDGCRPLDNRTIFTYYRDIKLSKMLESFLAVIGTTAITRPDVYQPIFEKIRDGMRWSLDLDLIPRMRADLTKIVVDEDLQLQHLLGLVDVDEFDNPRYGRVWPILAQGFIELCEAAYQDFENVNAPVPQKYGMVRLVLELAVRYSKNFEQYREEYTQAYRMNGETINQFPDKVDLPNMPGLESLMPHQNRTLANLDKTDGSGIVAVDAGGGKTIIDISDFFRLLAAGRVKRGLVIAPGNIVPEWVTEINTISQGKINAFPLNSAIYRRMMRWGKLSDEFLVNLLKGMPINSIVVTDFAFLRGRSEAVSYLDTKTMRFPNVEMLLQVGFDYIAVDESHRIKKQSSQQTQAVYLLSSGASQFRLLSGTIISDKPTDLVGQVGLITPAILGDIKQFRNTYGRGSSWAPDAATQVARRIQPFARQMTVKRREWAFLLPRIREQFHTVYMTPNQKQFYAELLREALDRIKNDPELMRRMEEGGEDVEAEIEAALKVYFAKLEIFMNAPDANAAFASLGGLREEDLLSPKLATVDELITKHLRGKKRIDENQDKIIVFGYNKAVSKHIYQHSQHKGLMVHYSAGNQDAVNTFRTDPKVQILVADETGLKEGINLQIASMMIRLQTLWSPGNQEQALSRIFRPDPRGKFKRDLIDFHWIVTDMSIEVAKTARLISKIITKAKFDEENNPSFRHRVGTRVDELPLISMNLKVVEDYTSIEDLRGTTGRGNFFGSYAVLKEWEDESFLESRQRLKEQIERRLGRTVNDDEVASLAMVPVESTTELPNSRGYFVPWIKNVTPTDFPELGLIAVSQTETDDEDDDDEGEDDTGVTSVEINVTKGDLVFTEYGPGFVRTASRKSLRVDIPGFGVGIRVPKYNVYVPTNQTAARKFEKKLKKAGKKGLPKLTMKGVKDRYFKVEDQSPREKEEERKKDKREGRSGKSKIKPEDHTAPDVAKAIHLHVALVNGVITLLTDADDTDASKVMPSLGYDLIEASYYQIVRSFRAMDRYMTRLDELYTSRKISLRDVYWEELERMQEIYKHNRDKLGLVKRSDFREIQRNFLLVSHRPPKDKKTLRPYSLVWDGELLILYNVRTQPAAILRRYLNDIQGVTKISKEAILAPSYVKMIRRKNQVKAELQAIEKSGITIQNMNEFQQELETLIG